MQAARQRARVAVVGASGYTGAEVVRLLLGHPYVDLAGLYAHKKAGATICDDFPHLSGRVSGAYLPYSPAEVAASAEVAVLGLPHGESVPVARELLEHGLTVLDLSADFRLRDASTYAEWYGAHAAPELLDRAVYGLVERYRPSIPAARLVAVPGCYPTATLLGIAPLLDRGLVEADGIVIDAKSGVSGAGRSPGPATHFPEAGEGLRAYKVAGHRHTPEIEQELSRAAGRPVVVTFTPYLVPMSRGILSTIYARPTESSRDGKSYAAALREAYAAEPFISVLDRPPDTAHVRGSNRVHLAAFFDARASRVIVMAAIDNLVKGAAGQAVQCLNLLRGWPEATALDGVGVFP